MPGAGRRAVSSAVLYGVFAITALWRNTLIMITEKGKSTAAARSRYSPHRYGGEVLFDRVAKIVRALVKALELNYLPVLIVLKNAYHKAELVAFIKLCVFKIRHIGI